MGTDMKVADLSTPALVIDTDGMRANLDAMDVALPGARLRPHVKAHKCTSLASEQAARGHRTFTCATPGEVVGMARAGLGDDLLLANQCVDGTRLRAMAECEARVTVAVDSDATIAAAAANGVREVVVDVSVGMPRCGCAPEDAGRLAELARATGLDVRGVMGYEGHVVGLADREKRVAMTAASMEMLARAHALVGGDVISAGGTGTYDINTYATEIQAGSYALMDNAYAELALPFRRALAIVATVIHAEPTHAVADCGLKAHSMDHGNPTIEGAAVWFCSDEHVTFAAERPVRVGERVLVWPGHVDPTIAQHARMQLADSAGLDATVIDSWPVDLRGWDV
jgi:D-serine deaminase-like pyridoxal phosphate-dependent protein